MKPNDVHIVCSSGGVRCLSYIGAFQKLFENNIGIASVSACSMGSVLGGLVCSGMDINQIEKTVCDFKFSKLKNKKLFSFFRLFSYPFATQHTPDYSNIMVDLLGKDITLQEMQIPFSAAALDIRQRRFLVYSSETHPEMKLSEVIRIATAIPFLYEPYKMEKRLLVDAAIASESPIWMAANNSDNLPIVVLRPSKTPNESYKKSFPSFLSNIISASSESHDYFSLTQTSRSVEINIDCEEMPYDNFNISKEQIENLILQGQSAAEQKLREFNYDFNNIVEIEEVQSSMKKGNTADKAEVLASQMITSYKNEVMRRNQVFVSYSRKDREWLEKLQTYLRPLERFTGIKAWNDTAIKPGIEWDKEIEKALVSAKVAVFLVTQNFLDSEFIQEREMKYFLEMSQREKVPILWIAVSSSLYEITPLNKIQCVNNPQKPLDKLASTELNDELIKISKAILETMRTGIPKDAL